MDENVTLPLTKAEVAFMPRDWSLTSDYAWEQIQVIPAEHYRCGICGYDVASDRGWRNESKSAFIRICPQCNVPTFFSATGLQIPGQKWGADVAKLPADVKGIFNEARASLTVNAFTGAVMLCRKVLMHVAVEKHPGEEKEAAIGRTFVYYVEWLIKERYAPRGAEQWVDYIRVKANEPNHQIVLMDKKDAEGILTLTEQLLRVVYELPESVPPTPASR